MIKVSVIIPVYGVEKYIERCAESLFRQTLDSIEFIFIDDCSPDRSMSLLEALIEKNRPRFAEMSWQVRTEKMPINSGLAAVRRHGIGLAKGEFIAHCDSDDWVEPDMYKLMYDKAVEEDADAVVCDMSITDGDKVLRTIRGCSYTDKELFIEQILLQNDTWSLCNKLFRRTACYRTDLVYPKGDMGEDFVLTNQLLLNSEKVAYVALQFYNYFFNINSITRVDTEDKKMRNFRINKDNADIVYGLLKNRGFDKRYSRALVSSKWYIKKLLWATQFDGAKRKLWEETYKEINNRIITNRYICLRDKVKFVLTYLRLFPRHSEKR